MAICWPSTLHVNGHQCALQGPHLPLFSQAVPHSLLLLQGSHGQAQVFLQLLNLTLRPRLDVVQLHVHVLVLPREALVLGPQRKPRAGTYHAHSLPATHPLGPRLVAQKAWLP